MNIGAGRVVTQTLPRIDRAVADGSLAANPVIAAFVARLRESGGVCHLMALLSRGGVHSHQRHIAALARIVAAGGVPVALHAVLDGRDGPRTSAHDDLAAFAADTAGVAGLRIATVTGRYYAMDRDGRWERLARAYDALVRGRGGTGRRRRRGGRRRLRARRNRRVRAADGDRRLRRHARRRRAAGRQLPRRPGAPIARRAARS